MFALLLALAHAAEPGAARGRFDSDCACIEVDPGVHAPARYSTAWLPVSAAEGLEHLVIVNKDFLSAVYPDLRVSIAEREDVGPMVGRVRVVRPDIPYLDNNSRNPCRHIPPSDIGAPEVLMYLEQTDEPLADASAVGKVLKMRSVGLGKCLGASGEAHVALKVSGSGKVKAAMVSSSLDKAGEQCVLTNLSKMKADISQKAPGTLQFALVTGR
jgi:hypothetical protein